MKTRLFALALLAVSMMIIPLSHSALSQGKKKHAPPEKVAICHFPDDSAVGHVIEVSENAVAAHVSKHGDCTSYLTLDTGGCRCLTCLEQCRVARARCEEACEGDTECIAACNATAQECVALCNGDNDNGGE